MNKNKVIYWFRQDLRLCDNPALIEAVKAGTVMPIYILDDQHTIGAASRVWLHHSLHALNQSLQNKLSVFIGDPKEILIELSLKYNINTVYWNRCYEAWRVQQDKQIEIILKKHHKNIITFNSALLWEPWETFKSDGTPYKVFTPFYRKLRLNTLQPRQPLPKPKLLKCKQVDNSLTIDDLNLLPAQAWGKNLIQHWHPGETGALERLTIFLEEGIKHYKQGRDFPALQSISRLSPHLHFGEVSPNQLWHAAQQLQHDDNIALFLRQLCWREFSYSLLYHFPELPKKNLQRKFNHFPWRNNKTALKCWQQGQTGYPIVDAGMRELWQTGYMHNRVRMIVGSFLVKNLRLHWHHGQAWFWDCLFDADLANNSASWQWVAGCGTDAAPYFRIFNPVTQGKKFDPEGKYTLQFVPELATLPKKYIYCPWEAPESILTKANIVLGRTYPKPIVDLTQSRQAALEAYAFLKRIATS